MPKAKAALGSMAAKPPPRNCALSGEMLWTFMDSMLGKASPDRMLCGACWMPMQA
jgi:hypothetical protein